MTWADITPAFALNAVLVGVAFIVLSYCWGRQDRHTPMMLLLTAAFASSVVLIDFLPRDRILPPLLAVDAAVAAVAASYALRGDARASLIMWLSAAKIAFAVGAVWLEAGVNVRAGGRNIGFLIQVLLAGGVIDNGLAWLGYRAREFARRRREVLYRVEDE